MKRYLLLLAVVVMLCIGLNPSIVYASPVVINFDDRAGMSSTGGFYEGRPVAPEYLVHDQYLSLGVLFESDGGGIVISASGNPVSSPNVAGATRPGPTLSYHAPVTATFYVGGASAIVDMVSLTLSNSSSSSTLSAFDLGGGFLGNTSGGASSTLALNFLGSIHSVRLDRGPFAFDDFTFNGLKSAAVPEPATLLGFGIPMLMVGLGKLKLLKK